jgi:hypothetical protein
MREAGKLILLKIFYVNSAQLNFIYSWKSRDKHRCSLANAGKTLFPKAQSIHLGFPIEKLKLPIKKSSLRHWQLILDVFTAPLPILVLCKTKGAAGTVCAIGNWVPNCQ